MASEFLHRTKVQYLNHVTRSGDPCGDPRGEYGVGSKGWVESLAGSRVVCECQDSVIRMAIRIPQRQAAIGVLCESQRGRCLSS